ncbi:MAG: hypothetical protein MJ252_10530 [archaeon]|nr:hypothetical protein [archaeon]
MGNKLIDNGYTLNTIWDEGTSDIFYSYLKMQIAEEANKKEKKMVHAFIVETPIEVNPSWTHHFISCIDSENNIVNYEWTNARIGIQNTYMVVTSGRKNNTMLHMDIGMFTLVDVDFACQFASNEAKQYTYFWNNCNHWTERVYFYLTRKEISLSHVCEIRDINARVYFELKSKSTSPNQNTEEEEEEKEATKGE